MLRTGLATVLLVLLVPAVVAANASAWALRTVLDSAVFSTTVGRALDAPTLERSLALTLSDGIVDRVERAPQTQGIDLARRLLAVRLGLAADAGAAEIRVVLSEEILAALQEPAVERVRDDVTATVHGYLVGAAEGEPGLISVQGQNVVLDTPRIVDRIVRLADPQLAALIEDVPSSLSEPVVIAQARELESIRTALRAMRTLQFLLSLVAVTAALLVVLLAHRRARALRVVGLAAAFAGLISLFAVWAAGLYVAAVPDTPVARQVTREVFDAFLGVLIAQSFVLVAAGVALSIVAWLAVARERRRATERMLGPR